MASSPRPRGVFLALFAATASIQSKTVTLTVPAAPMNSVLKQLSEMTGQRFEARGDVGDEIVCLRVVDGSLDDLLPRLAEVSGGEWKMAQNVHVLVGSVQFEKAEREALAADQRTRIGKSLKDLSAQFAASPTFDQLAAQAVIKKINIDIAAFRQLATEDSSLAQLASRQDGTPAQRLLIRLLRAIPLAELAVQPDGAKVVYSSQPNRMQKALPSSSTEAIATFVREESAWEGIAGATHFGTGSVNDFPTLPPAFKVNLSFDDWEGGPGASADLAIRDAKGKAILTANFRLDGFDDAVMRRNITPPVAKPGEQKVDEGSEADELRWLVQRDSRKTVADEPRRAALLAKWRAKLVDPAKFEPLAVVPGALWIKLAEARKENLVANAYEEAFSSYADRYEGPRTPSTILDKLSQGCKVDESNGWLTIPPTYLLDSRMDRIDRSAVGALIRASIQSGGPTIENVADYMAYHSKRYGLLAWDGAYLTTFFRGTGPNSVFPLIVNRDELRFYGLLSPQLRSQLRQRPLRLSELSPAAKQHLERMVYWNGWASDQDDDDPTELLPNGIPADGTLTLTADKTETLVRPYLEGVPMTDRNFSPRSGERLGRQYGMLSSAPEAMTWNRFQVLTGHRLSLRIDYARGLSKSFDLYEVLDPGKPALTYDQLPADFRAEVERSKKETKEHPPVNETPPPP